MNDLRTAAQQALEALENSARSWPSDSIIEAITALRTALEQPEQEPIGWLYPEGMAALKAGKCWTAYGTKQDDNNIPIYDAVAPRAEPRASESGAGFESLPASLEPEQEPVAWMLKGGHGTEFNECIAEELKALTWKGKPMWTPLYAAPPQRKPLSDEEIADAVHEINFPSITAIARAIEAAHNIKE